MMWMARGRARVMEEGGWKWLRFRASVVGAGVKVVQCNGLWSMVNGAAVEGSQRAEARAGNGDGSNSACAQL